jgi:hypothetical protein
MDVNRRGKWQRNIRDGDGHPQGHRGEEVIDWRSRVEQYKRRHRGDRRKGDDRDADNGDNTHASIHQKGNFTVASPA